MVIESCTAKTHASCSEIWQAVIPGENRLVYEGFLQPFQKRTTPVLPSARGRAKWGGTRRQVENKEGHIRKSEIYGDYKERNMNMDRGSDL